MEPLFISLEEHEQGREVPSTLSDDIEDNDEAARFLEEKRRELIKDPVIAEVKRISQRHAHFIRAVLENPEDPDAVFELAKKLVHRESSDALEAAKRLIGLSWNKDEIPKLRWPDNEQHIVLAAWILRKEQKFQAIVKMLTDETGRPRFPDKILTLITFSPNLGRLEDARQAIEDGIAHGLDWHVFASFQRQLRTARRQQQAESPRDHV